MPQNLNKHNLIISLFLLLSIAATAFGQEPVTPFEDDDVPPPTIALSKTEAAQLKTEIDLKERTILCLQFANSRLQQAETLTTNADFQNALSELGGYQAVIDDSLSYLKNLKNDSKKVRDNVKRLEIALRGHAPRLETIRRSTPFQYALRLKPILNFAREARSRALNLFFSDTVVPGNITAETPATNVSEKKQP